MGSAYGDLDRPPLDVAALRRALVRPGGLWRVVTVRPEVGSTNADLVAAARAGRAEPGTVLVAEHQTGGRGRLGRPWAAPPRSGLTFSVLLRPDGVPDERWPWLPLLAGVAVAEAVRRRAGVPAEVKWPNDVMVEDRKLAGVLVERVGGGAGALAVVGCGLNVTLRADELPAPRATSLALAGAQTTDRTVVLREVLRVLEPLYLAWVAERGDARTGLAEAYARRCGTLGRRVEVGLPSGSTLLGLARRIDETGRLIVDDGAEEVAVGAGDVVHVRSRGGLR